jgi:OOP family OmpA-OmpF porin
MSDRTASGTSAEQAPETLSSPTDGAVKGAPAEAKKTNGGAKLPAGAFDQLRDLLVGPERQTLTDLQQRVSNLPSAVADVLPQAVKRSSRANSQFGDALLPVTEENIVRSVKRNPRILADALFPIIGPATRKAIAEALGTMVQSMNQTLEHSISAQGLKWRMEAARTGKSFGEVVMLHTLLYRVEQVFLIHKETGLLLQHVAAPGVAMQDADMVSGMMTAIQDFVKDSFQSDKDSGGTLDTLRVGELVVWIEQGPSAILAGVIRGNAPEDLRLIFQQALEKIHADYGTELEGFAGDAALFETARPELESCLQSQFDSAKTGARARRRIRPLHLVATLLVIAIVVGAFFWVREYRRWNAYLARLQNEPGLVLISAERGWTGYSVRGLRDPLATDPAEFARAAGLNPNRVAAAWEPYLALSPEFVLKRAKKVLQPPGSVQFTFHDGRLEATGIAPREWITQSRLLARALPGVTEYRDENVSEAGRQQLAQLKQKLESVVIRFQENSAQLVPGQERELEDLIAGARQVFALAPSVAREFKVQLIGHTDSTGTENVNGPLSSKRAEAIKTLLTEKLGELGNIEIVGAGTASPLRPETSEQDKEFNRSVTVKIDLVY